MSSNASVIDNEKVKLLDQLLEILPSTKRASFAIGYFFISGFAEIMGSLKRIEAGDDDGHVMRLLISPTTDRQTAEALLAGNASKAEARKAAEAEGEVDVGRRRAADDVKGMLEHMPQTDSDQKAARKIAELIRKKKVRVKVYTKDRLHAKAYIFEIEGGFIPRLAIVGSSNLSISGIREHTELNLRTNDDGQARQLLEWFDRHWDDDSSVEFTSDVADILEMSWAGKERTPDDIYRKAALHEHDDQPAVPMPVPVRELFDFQKAAVYRAIKRLDEYGGVIIADVVGTGKSFIGSAIMKHLRETKHSKLLIICPPHLEGMWKDYLREFDMPGEVVSRYKIGSEDVLSRYTYCDAILVDESHNFRNSNTQSYKALAAFMDEKADDAYMVMLTATPISNTPTDLKNQLNLFPAGKLSNIPPLGDTALDEYFKGVMDGHDITEDGAEKVRELLRHVLIRRTRTQIMRKYAKNDGERHYLEKDGERMYFPKRSLRHPEEYDVDMVYNNSFEKIQDAIGKLKLARYNPGNYIRNEYLDETHPEYKRYDNLKRSSLPLIGIVRTSLLKRMESSIAAFADSVQRYRKGYVEFRGMLESGIVPIGKEFHDEIYRKISSDSDDYDQRRLDAIRPLYDIVAFDVDMWKADMSHDERLFKTIWGYIENSEYPGYDDKLHKLMDLVRGMRSEKILIFTESSVTARYVHKNLKAAFGNRQMEQIDSTVRHEAKSTAVKLFDPRNNNYDLRSDEKEIDILVSTDVLSEGVNMQAGRVVINYDFHWNPVKLIQRVGRIDRMGSGHDTIDVINFLPTTKIEMEISLKDRVASKIETIRRIIGHDQKILESTEVIDAEAVTDIYGGDESVLDSGDDSILNTDTESERQADDIRGNEDELARVSGMPFGIRSSAGSGKLLIACEANEEIVRDGNEIVAARSFRRHYEVTAGGCRRILPLHFLKMLGGHARDAPSGAGPEYNGMVRTALGVFDRDSKNFAAHTRHLKYQRYFDDKLVRVSDTGLKTRARRLLPFMRERMLTNHQPYRKIVALGKEMDRDAHFNDEKMVSGLEAIRENHRHEYKRRISRPRILYSVTVDE